MHKIIFVLLLITNVQVFAGTPPPGDNYEAISQEFSIEIDTVKSICAKLERIKCPKGSEICKHKPIMSKKEFDQLIADGGDDFYIEAPRLSCRMYILNSRVAHKKTMRGIGPFPKN